MVTRQHSSKTESIFEKGMKNGSTEHTAGQCTVYTDTYPVQVRICQEIKQGPEHEGEIGSCCYLLIMQSHRPIQKTAGGIFNWGH